MKRSLKNIVQEILFFIFAIIVKSIYFICDVFRYPVRYISVWAILALFLIIIENVTIDINGPKMFVMSAGLVAIVTFISSFLESQTVEIDKKENFYLGRNIKKQQMHDSFWLKRFNEVPIKLLYWITAIAPIIILSSEVEYNSVLLNSISENIKENSVFIKSFWVSVYSVNCFYCIAILIESVYQSRNSFSQSGLYRSSSRGSKHAIEEKIRSKYRTDFKKLFNRYYFGNNRSLADIDGIINYIFSRGKDVTNNELDYNKYISLAFQGERIQVIELQEKMKKYCTTPKNWIYPYLSYLLSNSMEMLGNYYYYKWMVIAKQQDIGTLVLLTCVHSDLYFLCETEKYFCGNEQYKKYFWGKFQKNPYEYTFDKSVADSNLCISLITNMLCEKTRDKNFFSELNDVKPIFLVLDDLIAIDKLIDDERNIGNYNRDANKSDEGVKALSYFGDVYKALFYDANSKLDKNPIYELFLSNIKRELNIRSEAKEHSKALLMRGEMYQIPIFECLLSLLDLGDIISVLIFTLAYRERSREKVISIEEYEIWKKVIRDIFYKTNESLSKLRKDDYISKLCYDIKQSYVSHFIYEKYLIWLWNSLFKIFDDSMYDDFNELEAKHIKSDFSLRSYIIVRLLLCDYGEEYWLLKHLSQNTKEKVKKDLSDIRNILKLEDIVI